VWVVFSQKSAGGWLSRFSGGLRSDRTFFSPDFLVFCKRLRTMKKYSKEDQILQAAWAADCAGRVLLLFERAYPDDDRPRKAVEVCRTWIRTGVFSMAVIRGTSLGAHAAARMAKENDAACFAARAAGQAVATAHVPQHALGSAYYALKTVAAADPVNAGERIAEEREWQLHRLPDHLREDVGKTIIIQECDNRILVRIEKARDF
jgi:hypothetical protein